jgi:hypothetical protein
LILGDYFKEYKYAYKIAESAASLKGWLNNHGKVQKMFDSAQVQISQDRTGQSIILAYIINVLFLRVACSKSYLLDNTLCCIH